MDAFRTEIVTEFINLVASTEERVYTEIDQKLKHMGQSDEKSARGLREVLKMTAKVSEKVAKAA